MISLATPVPNVKGGGFLTSFKREQSNHAYYMIFSMVDLVQQKLTIELDNN